MKQVALFFLLMTASACNFFSQPVDLQTENLQNQQAQTQISAVRATATVNADRMLITLENAQTAVGNIDLQSTRIASTLIAGGMTFVDASAITPLAPTQDAPAGSPIPQIANPLITQGVPLVSGQGSAQGDSALVQTTPSPIPMQTTVDPNGPSLTEITLTDQVGADDCPVGSLTSFSSSAASIYVTAVANNVTANSTLTADFTREGQEVQTYTWSPEFNIDGACVWFFMPSSDVQFAPGNWAVALAIDGAPAGNVSFSIVGDVPNQIDLNEDTSG